MKHMGQGGYVMPENPYPESSPLHHTTNIKGMMNELINHLREDVDKVNEPKAQALFETSAEVIGGLVKAFDDYEKKNEKAWQGAREA
jgi:hypothetical protein